MITTSQFTISKIYDGDNYFIQPSHSSVVLDKNGDYNPQEIIISNKYKQGADGLKDYSGRVKIETTSDNNNWTTQYASNVNESSVTYKLPSQSIDQTPYKFRASFAGDRMDDEIVGGSVVWNQFANLNGRTMFGITVSRISESTIHVTGTITSVDFGYVDSTSGATAFQATHVYIVWVNGPSSASSYLKFHQGSRATPDILNSPRIFKYASGTIGNCIETIATGDVDYTFHWNKIDLTAMFGTEVADYIYGLEQANAGAGVAYFRKLFPNDYYEYSEPELRHVEGLSSHEMVGFNLFDRSQASENKALIWSTGLETTEVGSITSPYIRVKGGKQYYSNYKAGWLIYDAELNYLGTYNTVTGWNKISGSALNVLTLPNDAVYLRLTIRTSMNNNIDMTKVENINANVYVYAQNGTYEPYNRHSYPLDSTLTLRGIPKLGDNGLYFDGDHYKADGTVERRYGVVDLGTLSWTAVTSGDATYFETATSVGLIKAPSSSTSLANIICAKYKTGPSNGLIASGDKSIARNAVAGSSRRLYVYDSAYTDAATFKTAMSGVMLVYELATTTTETATPYTALQTVDASGTEEYVSTSIVPVGHYTKYSKNITNIRCSLYEADGFENLLDQSTIPVIDNIDDKIFLIKVVPEYTVYTSATNLPSTVIWTETKPNTVDASHYLWTRMRSDFSDNSHTYSDAICDVTISGVISDVNKNTKSIADKVWESDITTKINQYDGSTVKTIRDRVTKTETDIDGITSMVSDVESETDDLGSRMSSAESSITQNADNIELKVNKDGVISSINQSSESITIDANKVNLVGNVSFNMFDNSVKDTITALSPELIIGTHGTTATAAWTGTSAKLTSIDAGTRIQFKMTSAGASNVTLNLTLKDGSETGAKPVYFKPTTRMSTQYPINSILDLLYDGASWHVINPYTDNNTNTVGSYGAYYLVAGIGTIRQYSLIMETENNTWSSFTSTSGTGTTKTKNTIGYKAGKIYYMSGKDNYASEKKCATCYDSLGIDFRYSANCGSTLVVGEPLYIIGEINENDGLFYLDDIWWTQTEPTTEDGKTYVYVGITYSNHQVYLSSENPVYQFYNGKFMTLEDIATLKAHNAADLANLWINESGKKAKQIIDNWATDATSATTTIKGGLIQTHTITANQLATNAIMSSNYEASTVTGSPYSNFGTFLDLSNGNFYTPNFGVKSTGSTGAYINGEIIATAGRIGENTNTAWDIGTFTDYEANDHGSIIGHGDAFIQSGKWMISQDSINTQWYDNNLTLTYIYDSKNSTYYDYGMTVPIRNTTDTGYISPTVSENFLYIRKHANTIPSAEGDWNYIFRVDKDGMIWINGQSLDQKYAAITDVGSVYLPKTGGTITGDLTVNGTLSATATKANQLVRTLSINGKSFDGSAAVDVGTLGVAYGGTGKTTAQAAANSFLDALSQGSSDPIDGDTYIASYADGKNYNHNGTNTYHRRSVLSLYRYIKSKLLAEPTILSDTYVLKSGDTITGSLTVENGITSDVGNFGDIIATGVGRFTNGLYGDLIGTASEAAKVTNNLKIQLNGGTTEGTNQFTYNGSAAKNINITASSVGAAASSHTHTSADITNKKNNTSAGALGWSSAANDTMVITSNTLAYWNGAYQNTSSNIEYVKAGKLGDIVTHKASDFLGASANAVSASKFNTTRTITLTGDVTGSASSDGTNGWSISTTVANDSHSHLVTNIGFSNSNLAGGLDPITIPRIGSAASNKSFGLPANAITIEYSRDGGATWQDYGATDDNKRDLFNETRNFGFVIGKATSKDLNTINNQLRITIEPLDRYVSFNGIYIWFSSNGNTCIFDLERSTIGAKETFSTVFTGQPVAGWSGNNIRYFSYGAFGGTSTQTSNYYKYRLTFRQTAINANYASGYITDIRFLGENVWNSPNNMVFRNRMYAWDRDFNVTFPADVTATAFHGNASSASKLNSTRSFTVGKTAKNVDWSGAVSFTQAEISDNASTTTAGWMSKDDKNKLNDIEAGAQVNTITGIKGSAETSYRTGNVNITAANIGLGNLTNNKQVKGLSSGTTSGHLVSWGADGYTVSDSGITKSQLVKSVASDANGKLILTYADDSTSDPIDVEFIATQTSSVSKAEALNVNGTAVGGSEQPVYFDNKGKPQTANKIPKLNNATTGGTFYAPTGAGTSGQILKSSGGTPTWVNQSTLSVGSATTAGAFSSDASVTLTGDTVGTASSTKGWSVATRTIKLSGINASGTAQSGNTSRPTTANTQYGDNALRYYLATSSMTTGKPDSDAHIIHMPWDTTAGWDAQIALMHGAQPHMQIRAQAGTANAWGDWATVLDSNNYNSYTPKLDGTGATGSWGIDITGNAGTATKFSSARSIALTGDTVGSASADGSSGWSISTSTRKMTTVGDNRNDNTLPSDYANKLIFQGLKTNTKINSPSTDNYSYLFGLRGWADNSGGNAHELAFNNSGIFRRQGATDTWDDWVKLIDSGNYTDYTVEKDGTGATGTWDINASTASKFDSTRTIALTGDVTGSVSGDGTDGWSIATTANQATKWTTAQKVYVTLGTASKTTTIQGGSTNAQTIGVDGTLGVAHGGTGKTTAKDAANEFMNALDTGSSTPVDADYYISQYVGGGTTTTTYHRRPMSALWSYIKGKSDSTYANITGDTFTGAVSGTSFAASSYMTVNSGNNATAGGLALYSTSPTNYGLAMRTTANQGKHGFVQGDWAIYSFMSGADDRGWVFKNSSSGKGNVASISNKGEAVFDGSVTVGGNAANDSGCRMEYNTETKSLDFIFN